MADGSQVGTFQNDELDFRPAKAVARPMANAAPDGLDFQPSKPAGRAPKAQAAPQESEIDFQPAEHAAKTQPATLSGLYRAPQVLAPTPTERAVRVGRPSPTVTLFAPKYFDESSVPRSPFADDEGAFITGTPMATEEEKQRTGILGPQPRGGAAHGTPYEGIADLGARVTRALGAGAPQGSKVAEWTGQQGTKDNPRLFAPEQLMTESEQQRHPILTGAGEFAGGFTSPEGMMLLGLTAGAGELAGPGAQTVKRLLAAGFSGQMLYGAAQKIPAISQAIRSGDSYNAQRLLTQFVLETGTAGLAARGTFEEPAPTTLPKGAISGPLALDTALGRGARRIQDFHANDSARQGMATLAGAERGIEDARQARINAPVEMTPTRGEPSILGGPPIGPKPNPLTAEAAEVRERQAARQKPDYNVIDMRRVKLGESEQPPYYEIAPLVAPIPAGLIEPPEAGEILGTRGRSKTLGEMASRVLAERDNSLVQRFGPDVLDAARQELNAAAGLGSSFERPGRYFSEYGDQNEHMPSRSTNAAKGIQAGGTWYGVSSARGMIENMHPWFADVAEGPETLSKIAQRGGGAAYDRILERVATHIQNERESARPVIEEYAPQLQSLASQIHDVDPELAQTLQELSAGNAVGFNNLREYIEGKIHDAQTAATFSRAIEDAAAEARESAGAQESFEPGGEARANESSGEAAARESAGSVASPQRDGIDFEPLPEPQPTNEKFDKPRRDDGVLPGMETAVREQRVAAGREQGRQLTERANRPPESVEQAAGRMESESPLFRGTPASPQREMFAPRNEPSQSARTFVPEYRDAAEQLGIEYRGVMGAEYGDKAAVVYQDPQSRTSVAVKVGEWSPERLEEKLAQARERMAGGELSSGPNPKALIQGAKILSRAWDERVARPLIDKVLKIGDKYRKAREADPAVAEGLHLLDNAPQYLRAKAAQEVHNVIGDLSRAQERLFTLMADADSRENLRTNHPNEYAQAQRDPAIQAALKKYKPLEQELTSAREKMGGENLDQDYLRRVYDKYVAGVNKPSAEGKPAEAGPSQFDRVIRLQNLNPKSREATAEYHYQNGLHEFGPAFATKFVATNLKALRDGVAQEFLSKATSLQNGGEEPRSITYGGERYFRPDVAREMRDAGAKNAKEYGYYDPTQGEKFPAPAEGRYLGPKEIVKSLTDYGHKEASEPGGLRRFFQEQILGFGFGVPHVFNILRRVTQQSPGGAANPQAWLNALKVGLGKELRERGLSGLNDPTFDMLAKHGAISTGEVSNLKEYIGGNLNPANWARGVAQIGHKALFEPGSFGGLGGIDQRARLYVADLMRSQRPELSDTQISKGVNDALGEYSRANWTDRQKLLGRFMMFPGWDFSSLRWVLQHPIRATVPPALTVMLANRALHSFGENREEDQNDISAVHIGDRAFSTGLLRESMARNLFRPALNYAQAKVRGESNQRALDEAARGITSGAGGLLSTMRPDLSGFVALATNRESLSSGKEIASKQDYDAPGKILPSKALEKQAAFTVRRALPALDRILDSNEDVDLRSFVGGNLGFPNYRDDAEKRLIRDTAEAEKVYQRVGKLAKTNPEQARQFLKDPDNATYALFYRDLAGMTKMLNRIDQAKEAVEGGKLSDAEKQSRLQAIEKARTNLLKHADGFNKLLFQKQQQAREQRPILGQPRSILGSTDRRPAAANPW